MHCLPPVEKVTLNPLAVVNQWRKAISKRFDINPARPVANNNSAGGSGTGA
jgi:hypothetical protein